MIEWTGHPPRPNGEIYKYVDVEHAEAVASGSLLIGTLDSYSAIEHKHDDGEGSILYAPIDITVGEKHENALERKALAALGFNVETGHVRFCGLGFRKSLPPTYCMCFSLKSDCEILQRHKPQAIFKVSQIATFVDALTAFADLKKGYFAAVSYTGKQRNVLEDYALDPSPFTKAAFRSDGYPFHEEFECRIAWPTEMHEISPFLIPPSTTIASFLTRIK